jgi:hypothetical protein
MGGCRLRRLLAIFMLNGVAAAIPATCCLLRGRPAAGPGLQPVLLLCFFGAAAWACRCG